MMRTLKNPNLGVKKLITKYHYHLFDDTEHDILFLQHCFELHWVDLTNHRLYCNEHLVWSDGRVAQFKSKRTWYHVARCVFYPRP